MQNAVVRNLGENGISNVNSGIRAALIGFSAIVCFGLAYSLSGFGTVYYSRLQSAFEPQRGEKVYHVKRVIFLSPSPSECVTNPWREAQGLPPRLRLTGDMDDYWLRTIEQGLWCLDEDTPSLVVVDEMREQRAARLLTDNDAPRQFWVVWVSSVSIAAWAFFVCAGLIRIWSTAMAVKNRTARVGLWSSGCFGASVLCVFPKLMLISWIFTLPLISSYSLDKYHWFPWALTLRVTDSARVPAAWSVLTACVCWFAIASMQTSLAACVRHSKTAAVASTSFSRFLLWSVPFLLVQYIVLSLILEQMVLPAMLAPW